MRFLLGGVGIAATIFSGGVALAGGVGQQEPQKCPAQQQAQDERANVLVIRTVAGQEESQMRDGAEIIPLYVENLKGADGKVDSDKVAQQTQDQLDKCQSAQLKANDGKGAPDAVQQEFRQADQSSEQESLSWRYWNRWGAGGYYGYGYRPYYGYYSSYYPYYGYYYGGYTYPYYYGGYYPYGRYGYYYYYRY